MSRTQAYHDSYYTEQDYKQITEQLPAIIKDAERKAAEVLEPTIHEKLKVMEVIKKFIREKNRKVYGGTAINEVIKAVNEDDAIYEETLFSDIEFYSPTPVVDLVELTNILYKEGFKHVQGKEAQHEESYTIFVNFQLYCDITYTPTRVYHGIKTIQIDGISYADPHFLFIDQLRQINDPINAASQRWEKTFKRMYKLIKNYPLEYDDKAIQMPRVSEETRSYIGKIKTQFLAIPQIQQSCFINGFEAYNFYIRHAYQDRDVEKPARIAKGTKNMEDMLVNVPYLEFTSVDYFNSVEKLYILIKEIVPSSKQITLDEYFPLFQFVGRSVIINYNQIPLVKIIDASGYCIPTVKTTRGYMYVTYQYLLMTLLISKFRSHLDKDREMYFNYRIAVSNLINARNLYLSRFDLPVINKSIFGEFRTACTGPTVSYNRTYMLRLFEKDKKGKRPRFLYTPESHFKQSEENQAKFDPSRHFFRNTSGNKVTNPKNLIFKLNEKGDIQKDTSEEGSEDADINA